MAEIRDKRASMEANGTEIADQRQAGPKGIGGWLLVFTLLIALLAVRVIYSSIFPPCWPDFGGRACADHDWAFSIISTLLLAWDIALILLRKKLAKPLSIVLCAMPPAALMADWVWIFAYEALEARRVLVDMAVMAPFVLWMIYFLRSRRVKNTLVAPLMKRQTA